MALIEVPFGSFRCHIDVSVDGCDCQVLPPLEVSGFDCFDPGGFWWEVKATMVEADKFFEGRAIVDILEEGTCRCGGVGKMVWWYVVG